MHTGTHTYAGTCTQESTVTKLVMHIHTYAETHTYARACARS